MVNIVEVSRVTRIGHIYTPLRPKHHVAPRTKPILIVELVTNLVEFPTNNSDSNIGIGQSSGSNINSDFDEILKLIKKIKYKVVDQLMQTPSKMCILSLL